VIKLKRENDRLAVALLRMREELQKSERYTDGLKIVLHERLERIDELNGKIDQLRAQNKRLDRENEHLAEMIRFAPQLDATINRRELT
jgi:septal ring factor EnvC (AmiA/AmiB activator)